MSASRMFGILVAVGLFASAAAAAERTYAKSFEVDSGARFELDSHKGSIRLRTHGKGVVEVTARIYPDGGSDPELVEQIEIRERASRGSVSLEADFDPPSSKGAGWLGGSWTMPLVDWDIVVPDDIEIVIDSHKSTFDLDVPGGRVRIESHKGSGEIRGVRSDFSLDTHKGKFDIEVLELHDFEIDTHKGEVTATIRGAHDFAIHGASHKGDLRFRGRDVPIAKERRESIVDYREGSGDHRIDIATHKGRIELRFD